MSCLDFFLTWQSLHTSFWLRKIEGRKTAKVGLMKNYGSRIILE